MGITIKDRYFDSYPQYVTVGTEMRNRKSMEEWKINFQKRVDIEKFMKKIEGYRITRLFKYIGEVTMGRY